jgi:hypothetical protein
MKMGEKTTLVKQNSLRKMVNQLLIEYTITEDEWQEMQRLCGKILARAIEEKHKSSTGNPNT